MWCQYSEYAHVLFSLNICRDVKVNTSQQTSTLFFQLTYIVSALLCQILLVNLFHQKLAVNKLGFGPHPDLQSACKDCNLSKWRCSLHKWQNTPYRDRPTCLVPLEVTLTTMSFSRSWPFESDSARFLISSLNSTSCKHNATHGQNLMTHRKPKIFAF